MVLPYGRQDIDDDDIAEVVRVLKSDFVTSGPEIPRFEKAFAEYVGAKHANANANGTAALHLIALAIGLKPGDQVVVPTVSFVATANAPHYAGAEVIFADVDPDTGLATEETLRAAVKRADPKRLKAIFIVHLGGQPVDLEAAAKIAGEAGVPLIEDACHALGSEYRLSDGTTGRIGDCRLSDYAAFSFHPVKTITTGEGGMVTTRHDDGAERLGLLRSHGLVRGADAFELADMAFDPVDGRPNPWFYELQSVGYNYRLTDFQAALGVRQLAKMGSIASSRRRLIAQYRQSLKSLAPIVRDAPLLCAGADPVPHLMVSLIDFEALGMTRAAVMERLRAKGVGTQVHYIPIHRQPYYRRLNPDLSLPGADAYYARCLSLPLFATMGPDDVETVVDALTSLVRGNELRRASV